MKQESKVGLAEEAFLLLKVFGKFRCASCGKRLKIGEEDIVVSEDFDLYHYSCHSILGYKQKL